MLIVNADDLGRSIAATDPVMSCHGKGRISSASAMVFMADSERAAKLSRDAALDVGLHVNLSEEFSAASVAKSVREAHTKVRRFLKASKYALLLFNPALTREFALVFAAQIEEFQRLYGRPPSHLDGHQHLHLATNVLVQKLMPEGAKVRRSFSFRPGEKGVLNRSYRRFVDQSLARRHRLTDYFFSLTDYMTPERLTRLAALAAEANVELMVHPERPGELAFLMSDAYAEALSGVRLAGYEAL